MTENTFTNVERSHSGNVPVMCRFLFKYKTFGEDYQVEVEGENLNKAMINFAKYYHQIEKVYSVVKVS